MKLRHGFVSNSSTSSFVVVFEQLVPDNLEYFISCFPSDKSTIEDHNEIWDDMRTKPISDIVRDAASMVLRDTKKQKPVLIDINNRKLMNKLRESLKYHWGEYMFNSEVTEGNEEYKTLYEQYKAVKKELSAYYPINREIPIQEAEKEKIQKLYEEDFKLWSKLDKLKRDLSYVELDDFLKKHNGKYLLVYSYEDHSRVEAYVHSYLHFKDAPFVSVSHH